jgi:CTP:molybdopterin cytidylyltransferase MocA
MGRSKQLLPLGPKPVIRHCLDSVIDAGIRDIVVVLGADSEAIAAAISSLPVRTIINDDPASDMAASVRLGLRAIAPASTGVLICLSDHPLVSPGTIAACMAIHHAHPEAVIIPSYQGRRGHPTLFPRAVIEDIVHRANLRQVIAAHAEKVRLAEVDDEGVVLDLDTPDDYERIKERFA